MASHSQIISSPNLENILLTNSYVASINNIFPNKMKRRPKFQTPVPFEKPNTSEKLNAEHNKMSHFPLRPKYHVIFSSIQNRKREIHMPNGQEIW